MFPPPPLLRMASISKSFGGVPALVDAQLELRAGEVHVLAGENGAGKSTLIKILAGVHTDHTGTIELRGEPVRFLSPQEAFAAGISVIHQELSLVPPMSVVDNVFLGRERSGPGGWMRRAPQRRSCRGLLERLGLVVDLDRPVEEFPISVQQMIEITKALAFDAQIIVMDEPTSALTEPEVERLFAVIDDLRERGCAIVYISHKMDEIFRVADRITVLRDGRHIGTAPAAELPRDRFIHWMVGRELDEQIPHHTPHRGEERLVVEEFTVPDPGGRQRPAVDGVSLHVRAGEILGIAGLQGSGASELLGGLFGAFGRCTRGEVTLLGEPFIPTSPRRSIERGLALLTNDRKTTGLILGMSLTHNTTLASLPRHSPGLWLRHGAERACAARHMETLRIRATDPGMTVSSLSGGNQQKVVLAKWLETQPRVLLLDEPTRGVDVGAKHEIYELMNRWTAEGIAIVLITSELPELIALSDRIIVMHRGVITAEFAHGDVDQGRILHAAMGHREEHP
ncbi:sugar ABC transporter ATP-binding protein [Candidatus Sumerlaeota bacterium]|nr:sugar ABC transporter ATP-binding protein [Candidatus Sumerlaeota bacterium]